ncbi:MAG: plastocyanin/azurin family copper-binding protein [Vicinamibacterales bacterium]|nr:plastocyanin/azurin family copper-binding protein [Vicinamibacterales bacterium]
MQSATAALRVAGVVVVAPCGVGESGSADHPVRRFRVDFWYDQRSMLFGESEVFDVRAHGLPGCLVAAAVLAMLSAACGTGAPVDPASEPQAALTAPAQADTGVGQITGMAPPANGVVVAIVLLTPHAEVEVPLPDDVPVMDQYGRQFVPTFLLVRQGQTINFTNSEDDLHTVHVKDSAGESLINVATLNGSSYEFTFDRADEYDVFCNTHTEMEADILVVDSAYAVVADRDGAFTMPDVIPGTYTATVLQGEERTEREIDIAAGQNEIDLTGP